MALFGEKYGDQVRVVTIGDYSKELCGGTHCGSTGEVGAFLIQRESSTAAGIRRIEALTGQGALEYVQQDRKLLHDLTSSLKVSRDEIVERIQDLMERNKKLEKEIERLKSQAMMGGSAEGSGQEFQLPNGRKAFVRIFPEAEPDQIGEFVDQKAQSGGYAVTISGSASASFLAVRATEPEDATQILRNKLAPELEGRGGGRKDFAKGGFKKLKELSPAEAEEKIKNALTK
jgi:alanyl-tRNA synthetase